MEQFIHAAAAAQHILWNKGKLVGQKAPLKLKDMSRRSASADAGANGQFQPLRSRG